MLVSIFEMKLTFNESARHRWKKYASWINYWIKFHKQLRLIGLYCEFMWWMLSLAINRGCQYCGFKCQIEHQKCINHSNVFYRMYNLVLDSRKNHKVLLIVTCTATIMKQQMYLSRVRHADSIWALLSYRCPRALNSMWGIETKYAQKTIQSIHVK